MWFSRWSHGCLSRLNNVSMYLSETKLCLWVSSNRPLDCEDSPKFWQLFAPFSPSLSLVTRQFFFFSSTRAQSYSHSIPTSFISGSLDFLQKSVRRIPSGNSSHCSVEYSQSHHYRTRRRAQMLVSLDIKSVRRSLTHDDSILRYQLFCSWGPPWSPYQPTAEKKNWRNSN